MNLLFRLGTRPHFLCAISRTTISSEFIAISGMSKQKRTSDSSINDSHHTKIRCTSANSKSEMNLIGTQNVLDFVEVMDEPIKSENDKKSYRIIRLGNGLQALLISDPNGAAEPNGQENHTNSAIVSSDEESENDGDDGDDDNDNESDGETEHDTNREKLSACSLCVDVGSFSDPREVQGLAHFLEHMIFMGSEKYPNENDFDSYMQKAGGFDNADTDFEETSFYFETRDAFLDGALDRFSYFFKAPLMLKEAMTREREAVESEFASKRNDEDIRREQLLSMIGQSKHPLSTFAWGNLITLKDNIDDDILYEKVHEFRKRHYSAHRMYLCLQSRRSLDELQKLVVEHFSTIPNNELPGTDFTHYNHHNAFQSRFYDKAYFVQPIGNISKVDITWCMESQLKNFKTKPDQYISYILGYEGEGSLMSYLRKKLWAVDLVAGTDDSGLGSNSLLSLFSVVIHLTDDGFDHLDDVLSAFFSYVKLLQSEGPNEELFRQIQQIEATAFKFATERSALDNVEDLVIGLKQYPPKYVLNGDTLYFEYDPAAIQAFIVQLNTRRFNVMITSKRQYDKELTYDSVEPWFGTKFAERDMPAQWIQLWNDAKPLSEFTLPQSNPFIADDFTIFYNDGDVIAKYPTKILQNDVCELWYRPDDKFLLPTACYYFYFISPLPMASLKNMIMMTLLQSALKYHFVEKLYPATSAGLGYSSYASDKGLVFKANGYNQKLHLLVDLYIKSLKSVGNDTTEEQFNMFVQQIYKAYENISLKPKAISKELRLYLLEAHREPLYDKNQYLSTIRFKDFQQFCHDYCKQIQIKAIIQGNVNKDQALSVMHNVLNALNCGKIENPKSVETRTSKIPIASNYLRAKTYHPKDDNTVVTNFYQIGPINYRTQVLLDLLLMIAEEPLFDKLRNKEQLGYDISSTLNENYGILAYSITVNSQETKYSSQYIDQRIENFRFELIAFIEQMSDDDFEAMKTSLAKIKLNEDDKLSEEITRNWAEITTEDYQFDRHYKEVDSLSKVSKSDLLEFYRAHYGDNQRKLSVQVIGNKFNACSTNNATDTDHDCQENVEANRAQFSSVTFVEFDEPVEGNLIRNLKEFKKSLEIYPISRSKP